MNYSQVIKRYLENETIRCVLEEELKLPIDVLEAASNEANLCCSNDSYIFIYLEQPAAFLALSLDKLCKWGENASYKESFQVI
jgi:hypothetical protein